MLEWKEKVVSRDFKHAVLSKLLENEI
jgi:hypothetical protein